MCLRSRGLHVELDEQVVASPPTAHLLAKDVHRDAENAHGQGSASEGKHDLFRALGGNPVVGEVGEAVKHKVLWFGWLETRVVTWLCAGEYSP